eukprot:SAG22_NODE_768_length_7351_cov_27.969939_6_plen_313_part_00
MATAEGEKIPFTPLKLGFPVFTGGAKWSAADNCAIFAGGGGPGNHGIPNKIVSRPPRRPRLRDAAGPGFPESCHALALVLSAQVALAVTKDGTDIEIKAEKTLEKGGACSYPEAASGRTNARERERQREERETTEARGRRRASADAKYPRGSRFRLLAAFCGLCRAPQPPSLLQVGQSSSLTRFGSPANLCASGHAEDASSVASVDISGDNGQLAGALADGKLGETGAVKLFVINGSGGITTIQNGENDLPDDDQPAQVLGFEPAGKALAVAGDDAEQLGVYEFPSLKRRHRVDTGCSTGVRQLALAGVLRQ